MFPNNTPIDRNRKSTPTTSALVVMTTLGVLGMMIGPPVMLLSFAILYTSSVISVDIM